METDVLSAAIDELASFERTVPVDDRLKNDTELSGWNVEALVRHVAAVVWQQSEALHRARLGIQQTPSYLTVDVPPEQLVDALRAGRGYLEDAIAGIDDEQRLVPLPFATLPLSLASYLLLIEYGVHAYDLDRALGVRRELTPVVAAAVVDLLPAMLPALAAAKPDRSVAISIDGGRGEPTVISCKDDEWTSNGSTTVDTQIVGSPSAVALFVLGRIAATHASISVDGDASLAARFKEFFPGP